MGPVFGNVQTGGERVTALELCLICAGLGACIALIVSVFAMPIGRRLSLLDWPDGDGGRKRHARVTPLVGGVAMVIVTIMAALLAARQATGQGAETHAIWLALAVGAMFTIGAADDRFHLSPILRLSMALSVLLLVISQAPDFALTFLRFSGQPGVLLLGVFGSAFTLLCLVGLLNAVNMADGKNGIVIGQGLIWSLVLAAHAPAGILPVLAAAGAALAVLSAYNLRGRLFLGDGGSYALSALFGLVAIYVYNHDFARMRADDVALLFAIPVFDTIRLMATRSVQGRSPFEGDRNHLHHHLYEAIGWPRGLWVYLAMVALPNAAAVIWPGTGLMWLAISFLAYAALLFATRQRAGSDQPVA